MGETVQDATLDIIGTRLVRKDYPTESGLTVGTQKQEGRQAKLKYSETKVSDKEKVLL